MKKASHNTFSYARPLQWWLRPLAFVARCQSKTLEEQYAAGVRIFDIRLRKDENGEWVIAHNAFIYAKGLGEVHSVLGRLNDAVKEQGERVYVRVLHEVRNSRQARHSGSVAFNALCEELFRTYRNIGFFGGQRVMDWRQDYVFPLIDDIYYEERHASVRWPKWLHWWPWLYVRLHNEKNEREYATKDVVVFVDFL